MPAQVRLKARVCVRGWRWQTPFGQLGTRATSFRTDRQAAALFLIAPMSAVSMFRQRHRQLLAR
jgi:hypothetical protein